MGSPICRMAGLAAASIESRASWVVAMASLVVISVAAGAPFVAVVALKPIASELGSSRAVPALAGSLAWLGSAVGGIVMGRIADRIGVRWTAIFGALMIAGGLALSSGGRTWELYVGHGLLIGLLGNAGINAPLYVYVSRWFDRRRGTALALISSGQYVAGAVWPPIFQMGVGHFGWRHTMDLFGVVELAAIVPVAVIFLSAAPEVPGGHALSGDPIGGARVLGMRPGIALGFLSLAAFLCCVPMAMPQGHLVAFCSDLGIPPSEGAAMLSMLLGSAFLSRQFWGWISDRIGGLRTVLVGSALQALALVALLLTQDEIGLFAVSAAFGFGFSGLVPAYVLAIRDLFPAAEASWRVPIVLLCSGSGMATGGWLAGEIYDYFGFYAPAFAVGVAFNLANFLVVGSLVVRQRYLAIRRGDR